MLLRIAPVAYCSVLLRVDPCVLNLASCQGGGAYAGCNVCHFEGRRWGGRIVYDGHRRYDKDKRAKCRKKSTDPRHGLQYAFDETGAYPKKRTYEEYVTYAKECEDLQVSHSNGVKGLWVMHMLPYAKYIRKTVDPMHTSNNVITDYLNSLRPSHGSTDSSSSRHQNRILSQTVLQACKDDNIFLNLVDGSDTSCVLTRRECIAADTYHSRIVGACSSEELPKNVLKKGKARNSHDTIYWATTWARWCLHGMGSEPHVANICNIFDILGLLNASQLHIEEVKDRTFPLLIKCIIKRTGLVPPCESTITQHEMIHVCEQVWDLGLPRVSTLFKYERINLFLKVLLRNKAAGEFYTTFILLSLLL